MGGTPAASVNNPATPRGAVAALTDSSARRNTQEPL